MPLRANVKVPANVRAVSDIKSHVRGLRKTQRSHRIPRQRIPERMGRFAAVVQRSLSTRQIRCFVLHWGGVRCWRRWWVEFSSGWPLGVAMGVWQFRGERLWLMVLMVPLLLPTFLLAIGLSMLRWGVDGFVGTVWAHACAGVPLVLLAARMATVSITRSQADAAWLGGGERMLYLLSLRAALPTAGLAAMLAGVMTLADPGPGQIFGWSGAAGQLLVSFAAQYDRSLAMQQAWWLTAAALLLTAIPAWRWAPGVAMQVGARDTVPMLRRQGNGLRAVVALVVMLLVGLPVAGLCLPLGRHPVHTWPLARAWSEISRTASDTLVYASLAAVLAVVVGFLIAAMAGERRRRGLVLLMVFVLAVPPALPALALIPWSHALTLSVALCHCGGCPLPCC